MFRFVRKQVSYTSLILILVLFFTIAFNYPFLHAAYRVGMETGDPWIAYGSLLLLLLFLTLVFSVLMIPYFHRIIIPILIIISSSIAYSEIFYGVIFDTSMLTNVLQTNVAESIRMLNLSYILFVLFFGVLPAVLYCFIKIKPTSIKRELVNRSVLILTSLLVVGVMALFSYKNFSSFFRNNVEVKNLVLPGNFIGASINKIRHHIRDSIPYTEIDLTAHQSKHDNYKHLTILIVGETTRSQNWGLNGYDRNTTPKLAARGDRIINFRDVSSCGTATAVSVPCMFSIQTKDNYNSYVSDKTDNILDIYKRAGIDVYWLDNDSGCKGVCDRVKFQDVTKEGEQSLCSNGECLDNILLKPFYKIVDSMTKDTVIVLHTIGNHGPTYFERSTVKEKLFTEECGTSDLTKCTDQEIVNSYDNAIVYADQFIDKVIRKVENRGDLETAVIYVSDHGESLGENGLYLHGLPYRIAPDYQTKVPMVFWFNDTWITNEGIDLNCVRNNALTKEFSHDNYFHTLYGMMDMSINKEVYDSDLDILEQCRVSQPSDKLSQVKLRSKFE